MNLRPIPLQMSGFNYETWKNEEEGSMMGKLVEETEGQMSGRIDDWPNER